MKKIFLSKKHRNHNLAKQKKFAKLAAKRKSCGKKVKLLASNLYFTNLDRNEARITAPENFSLINNVEVMLRYFYEIDNCIRNGKNIFLDISNITTLTEDAILYMLSRLDFYEQVYPYVRVAGNRPVDEMCNKLFGCSGFFDYVYTKNKSKINSDDVYSIKSDTNVNPVVAKDIIEFSKNKLNKNSILNTKGLYASLIECMANTNNHAYKDNDKMQKWWLIAAYDKVNNVVNYTFLDNGFGIPNTIRKDFVEIVKELLPMFSNSDSYLIQSSLEGMFRTRTRNSYRGKGLPKIYNYSRTNQLMDLKIISRRGYVDCGRSISKDLKNIFHGTLLTWSLT